MNIVHRVSMAALCAGALLCLSSCSSSTASIEPLAWQKVPGSGPSGALMGLGSAGSFDESGTFTEQAVVSGSISRVPHH